MHKSAFLYLTNTRGRSWSLLTTGLKIVFCSYFVNIKEAHIFLPFCILLIWERARLLIQLFSAVVFSKHQRDPHSSAFTCVVSCNTTGVHINYSSAFLYFVNTLGANTYLRSSILFTHELHGHTDLNSSILLTHQGSTKISVLLFCWHMRDQHISAFFYFVNTRGNTTDLRFSIL